MLRSSFIALALLCLAASPSPSQASTSSGNFEEKIVFQCVSTQEWETTSTYFVEVQPRKVGVFGKLVFDWSVKQDSYPHPLFSRKNDSLELIESPQHQALQVRFQESKKDAGNHYARTLLLHLRGPFSLQAASLSLDDRFHAEELECEGDFDSLIRFL